MGVVEEAQAAFRVAARRLPEVSTLPLFVDELGTLSALDLVQDDVDEDINWLRNLPLLFRLWRRNKAAQLVDELVDEFCASYFSASRSDVYQWRTNADGREVRPELRTLLEWLCLKNARDLQVSYAAGGLQHENARRYARTILHDDLTAVEPDFQLPPDAAIPPDVAQSDDNDINAFFQQCLSCVLTGVPARTPLGDVLKKAGDIWPQMVVDGLSAAEKPFTQLENVFEMVAADLLPAFKLKYNVGDDDAHDVATDEPVSCLLLPPSQIDDAKTYLIKNIRGNLHQVRNDAERAFYAFLVGQFSECGYMFDVDTEWDKVLLAALVGYIRDTQFGLRQDDILFRSQRSCASEVCGAIHQVLCDPIQSDLLPSLLAVLQASSNVFSKSNAAPLLACVDVFLQHLSSGPEIAYCDFLEAVLCAPFKRPLDAAIAVEAALLWREVESEARDQVYSQRKNDEEPESNPFDWVERPRVKAVTAAALRRYVELCVAHRPALPCDTWARRAVRLVSCGDSLLQRKLVANILASELQGMAHNDYESLSGATKLRSLIYEAAAECPKVALSAWLLVKDGLAERMTEVVEQLNILNAKAEEGIEYEHELLYHDGICLLYQELALYIQVCQITAMQPLEDETIFPPESLETIIYQGNTCSTVWEYSIPDASVDKQTREAESQFNLLCQSLLLEAASSAALSMITLGTYYFPRLTETEADPGYDATAAVWGVSTRDQHKIFWKCPESLSCSIPRDTALTEAPVQLYEFLQTHLLDGFLRPWLKQLIRTSAGASDGRYLLLSTTGGVPAVLDGWEGWLNDPTLTPRASERGFASQLLQRYQDHDTLAHARGGLCVLTGVRTCVYAAGLIEVLARVRQFGIEICKMEGVAGEGSLTAVEAQSELLKLYAESYLHEMRWLANTSAGSEDRSMPYVVHAVLNEAERLITGFARFLKPHQATAVLKLSDDLIHTLLRCANPL